jgi:8-oxo-dGTP pyrophosphatase MutT (NUDIX family)
MNNTAPSHQLTSNVKLLQKVVVQHQDKILLLQREPQSLSRPNYWDVPGGNSEWPTGLTEPTSNLHQADAAREVQEESGITIDPTEFTLDKLVYFETFFHPQKQVFTILCGWKIRLPNNFDPASVVISDEHSRYQWLNYTEALQQDFGGPVGSFMNRIISAAQTK